MVVAQQHGAVTPVEIGFHPHGGGLAADLALFSGHADAPEKVDKVEATRHRKPRHLVSSRRRQPLIGIERPCFGELTSRLSIVTVSTPFLNDALIESWLASSGRFKAR